LNACSQPNLVFFILTPFLTYFAINPNLGLIQFLRETPLLSLELQPINASATIIIEINPNPIFTISLLLSAPEAWILTSRFVFKTFLNLSGQRLAYGYTAHGIGVTSIAGCQAPNENNFLV
jgi:hypothetical protein